MNKPVFIDPLEFRGKGNQYRPGRLPLSALNHGYMGRPHPRQGSKLLLGQLAVLADLNNTILNLFHGIPKLSIDRYSQCVILIT